MTQPLFLKKIAERSEVVARLQRLPRPIVFTNGVFDVLHRGHVGRSVRPGDDLVQKVGRPHTACGLASTAIAPASSLPTSLR